MTTDNRMGVPQFDKLVATITVEERGEMWQVMFNMGVQHFSIGPEYDVMEEAQWMQKQFQEFQQKFVKLVTGIDTVDGAYTHKFPVPS